MPIFLANNSLAESFMIRGIYKMPFLFLGQEVWITTTTISTIIITIMLLAFGIFAGSKLKNAKEIPTGFQNFIEMAVEALNSMGDGILGENKNRFINYIGTIFLFILTSNLSGFMGMRAPTADYGVTFCLGIFTFAIVQFQGIKNHGIGHFTSLFQPVPVLFPINLIGEFANPLSISLRLFANLLSGVIMLGLWYGMMPIFAQLAIPSFLHAYCDLFSGCIQTYVFCMLTMVYVNDKL
ncbi:MAG: F0F1 ATP synthase subunit A [Lachnospiraceae bacterium]|nr:F0F1 ATP synthase subunit A [Lachnospiraceae bacterium]